MNDEQIISVKPRLYPWVVVLLLVALIGGAWLYREQLRVLLVRDTKSTYTTADLLAEVSKLVVLPAGEEPVIATVMDLNALSGQPLFANAHLGDKVIIYNTARKAILYSPTLKRVIDVAPLTIGTPSPTPKQP